MSEPKTRKEPNNQPNSNAREVVELLYPLFREWMAAQGNRPNVVSATGAQLHTFLATCPEDSQKLKAVFEPGNVYQLDVDTMRRLANPYPIYA